jgi:hypothetical protein
VGTQPASKGAQDALAHVAKTHNLSATASQLRSANGLLDLLARIEMAKAEELKAQQATAALQNERALEDGFNCKLDELREKMEQAQAAAPKCPRCGRALPHGVQVRVKWQLVKIPSRSGPGCIDTNAWTCRVS